MIAMRWSAALAMALTGCLHPSVQQCSGGGETWVCPAEQACAQPPTYCSTPNEVGACEGKADNAACSSSLVADGLCEAGACTACSVDIAHCRYVGWKPMTSGTTADLTAVAFTKFGEAYAGTATGAVLHYLTSGWTTVDLGMADVTKVVAIQVSGTRVYALLSDTSTIGQRVVYRETAADSGTWTALPDLAAGSNYVAMWIAPTGDVFLAGGLGGLAHYGSGAWSETVVGTAVLKAVWGTSTSEVYAVGNGHTILRYDGAAWASVAAPATAGNFNTVWGVDGQVFIGTQGSTTVPVADQLLRSSAGGPFAAMPTPGFTITPRAIWGSSGSDVWVVGDNASAGEIVHWDGVSWTQVQAPPQSVLRAIAGSGVDEIFAVGATGTILRYTGAAWAAPLPPTVSTGMLPALYDIWAAAPNDVIAVGAGAFHLQPSRTWATTAGTFVAIAGRSPTDAVAVGNASSAVWNGTSFAANSTGFGVALDVAATPTSYVSIANEVYTSATGATWAGHPLTPATLTTPHALWVAPSGTIWFATGTGVQHADASYALTSDVGGASFTSIWGFADDDIYVVGANDVRHYDGTSWTPTPVPSPSPLDGVWGRSTDDVFAVGANQTVLHYHGGAWKQLETPFTGDLAAVTGAGTSVFMVSTDGKVYQLVETAP
jgi:hypothetical protein